MDQIEERYYVKTKKRWLSMIDKQLKASKEDVIGLYGPDIGNEMQKEIRMTFESLLPEIPELDPETSNLWTRQLVLTTIFLSVYKVMKVSYNKSLEEAWEMCMIMFGSFLKTMPKFVRKLALKESFSKKTKLSYQKDDKQLHKRLQPEGDVFDYIDGVIKIDSSVWKKEWDKYLLNRGSYEKST